MSYAVETGEWFEEDYKKLCSKNASLKRAVDEKVKQITIVAEENPDHYKPLKAPLEGIRRTHVGASFVLMFEILKTTRIVRLVRLEHHDKAYKNK